MHFETWSLGHWLRAAAALAAVPALVAWLAISMLLCQLGFSCRDGVCHPADVRGSTAGLLVIALGGTIALIVGARRGGTALRRGVVVAVLLLIAWTGLLEYLESLAG